jgi:isopentenyl-diphosphate Delta-isomerase
VIVPGLVELVDREGRPVGVADKAVAHEPPGRLHRAISVFLLDADGGVILQRRAAGKYHSAGLWSNTCCGHPAPGEDPEAAARRRLAEELGIVLDPLGLEPSGTVVYEVGDPGSGLVEREYDHLFVGRSRTPMRPNAVEVAEVRSIRLDDLTAPSMTLIGFTAWFPIVLNAAIPALVRAIGDDAPS